MPKIASGLLLTKPQKDKNSHSKDCSCIVHTLGQVGHIQSQQGFQPIRRDKKYLKQRAKNTYFSKELARALTQIESPLNKAYRRTLFDCNSIIMQEGKKLTSKYCDSRWCNTCNRIRTAKLLNGYIKPLSEFKEPYFVTLTIPNPKREDLKAAIIGMIQTFSNILKANRRAENGGKIAFNGVRKLECTYNDLEDNYHPHFHVIIDGRTQAEKLKKDWLSRYRSANSLGQDIKVADPGTLKELFKYTTKLVTKSKSGEKDFRIYVPALDTIFQSMYKLRTFQSFGNVRMISENIENLDSENYDIEPYDFLVWEWIGNDWKSMVFEKNLSGYEPSKEMDELLSEKMVT
jgi:plasmid rolling circle replication initiator protein Rep